MVRRLIQQNPSNTETSLLELGSLAYISVYLRINLAKGTAIVVNTDIANYYYVCLRIQLRYLPRIITVYYENVSRSTVRVHYYEKFEVGVTGYPVFNKCKL